VVTESSQIFASVHSADTSDQQFGRWLLQGDANNCPASGLDEFLPRRPDGYRTCSSALSRLRFLRLRLRASADFTRFF
jgi:hypothetical protein